MRHTLSGAVTLLLILQLAPSPSAHGSQEPGAKTIRPGIDSYGDPLPKGVFYRLGTVRLRHQHVATLFFSADGSQLLSQGTTDDLRLWDVATGRIVAQLAVPKDLGINHVIASPDHRYLACLDYHQHVVLLDRATAKQLARWENREGWHSLAFSRDGKELIGLTQQLAVVKWNVVDRKETTRISLDTAKVNVTNTLELCHLSPDGTIVAFLPPLAKGQLATAWHFWDTTTGKQCRPPQKSDICRYAPDGVHWSADGRLLAIATTDDDLQVWDMVAGKHVVLQPTQSAKKRPAGTDPAGSAAFHPGGKLLAVARLNRVVVWDLDAKKQLWEQDVSANRLAFSRDGKTLAVGGWGSIELFQAASGERVGFSRIDSGTSFALAGWIRSPAFLRHGRSFIAYDDAGISELDIATGKRLQCFDSRKKGFYRYGGLCDDRRRVACVGNDEHGKAHLFMFDAATGKELWRRPKQPGRICCAADGKTLAVWSWTGDVFTLLDASTGRDIRNLAVPWYEKDTCPDATVSDDLRLAATTQGWRKIDLWDLGTGKLTRSLECPPDWDHGELHFIAGSRLLIAAPERPFRDRDQKREWTRIWDVASGRVVRSFPEPMLEMSADGRWLVLGGDGGKGLVIRHLHTGRLVATIPGGFPLALSADGSLLALSDPSGHEVGLWDTLTGRRVCRWLDPLAEFVYGSHAVFSPDGRTLVLTPRTGGSMLVCDVTGMTSEPCKIPAKPLTPAEFDRHWMDLNGDDGPRSHRARWSLVAGGEDAVKMLKTRLRPVEPLDAKRLAALIADLDSDSFEQRQNSTETLERMELARPALEDAIRRDPSVEMRRRIAEILAKLDAAPWDAEMTRALRGVLLLEQIGTSSARHLLQTMASGALEAVVTQQSQAALHRLAMVEDSR